mmetsp:Transcript_26741/g.39703  ORF Transcript_26741/g.39703 Transcript_26741/m.39703 type:complete len:160 (-) Transcript_26741:11-490(-)
MAYSITDFVIIALQCYFLTMNLTVERCYCEGPFEDGDNRFLIQETISFCSENNRLFLARPEWMVVATCASAYILSIGYTLTSVAAVTNSWKRFAVPLLLFVGAKMNAILFYHYMEFTSSLPPQNLVPYLSVELPYVLSMVLVVLKVYNALYSVNTKKNV